MRYLLIDANHLASRCRHAKGSSELRTSDGRRSNVVSGVLRSMSWIKNDSRVDENRIICFWDGGRAQARMELYPDYKAGRTKSDPTPDDVQERREYYEQIDALIPALSHLGIRQVKVAGTEADDLISIYASFYERQGHDVIIHSGDYDLHQLVSPSVKILHPEKGLLGVPEVLDLWKLPFIHHIPMMKALTGDSSDAIKGVPGIGKKRALLAAPYQHLILGDCERPSDIPESTWKWIEKARSNQDIVIRNLKMMLLPLNFEKSFYTAEQAEQVVRQVKGEGRVRSLREFILFCHRWELVTILENLHHWQ